jgi:hypothetical protein
MYGDTAHRGRITNSTNRTRNLAGLSFDDEFLLPGLFDAALGLEDFFELDFLLHAVAHTTAVTAGCLFNGHGELFDRVDR